MLHTQTLMHTNIYILYKLIGISHLERMEWKTKGLAETRERYNTKEINEITDAEMPTHFFVGILLAR